MKKAVIIEGAKKQRKAPVQNRKNALKPARPMPEATPATSVPDSVGVEPVRPAADRKSETPATAFAAENRAVLWPLAMVAGYQLRMASLLFGIVDAQLSAVHSPKKS